MIKKIPILRSVLCYLVIAIFLSIIFIYYGIYLYKKYVHVSDFRDSIYLITEDKKTKDISYYEVNFKGDRREIEKFEAMEIKLYETKHCYNSYVDENLGIVNRLHINSCTVTKNDTQLKYDEIVKTEILDILNQTEKLKHSIVNTKIFEVDGIFYTSVELNVNLWSPYEFYRYNKEKKELELIHTFDGEDIIGIKLK